MAIIILQGASATGKTRLAKRLSHDLAVPYLGKDTIKELFFDVIGYPESREQNHAYGRVAMATLFSLVAEYAKLHKPLIIDCAQYDKEAAAELSDYVLDTSHILQLYLTASPRVLQQRYNDRLAAGERHVGHGDTIKSDPGVFDEYSKLYRPLNVKNTITVDTTQFSDDDYATIVQRIRRFIRQDDDMQ